MINWKVPTVALATAIDLVFEAPNVAVPVGTVAGSQLPESPKLEVAGLAVHVASCAWTADAARQAALDGSPL